MVAAITYISLIVGELVPKQIALRNPEMIATTFGRHVNDNVTSFYSWSPSKFMFEYGWGGRTIDTENWKPEIITQGPSLLGHERYWLNEQQRNEAREQGIRLSGLDVNGK